MLPTEFNEVDKQWVNEHPELNLETPKDLEKYKDSYFVSEMMAVTSTDKIKELIKQLYERVEETIKKDSQPNQQELDGVIRGFMDFDVFRIEDFVAHPENDLIFVELYSFLYNTDHMPVPLMTGIILTDQNKIFELRKKALDLSKYVDELFYKGFGKNLNLSQDAIKLFYDETLENIKEDKEWDLTEEDKQFLKDFRIKSSKKK